MIAAGFEPTTPWSRKRLRSSGKPSIKVFACRRDDETVYCIEDNGPGIDPAYRERVFDLFDRIDTSVPGTGIGLTVVKRIIDVHGGSIWLEAGDGGCGTRVSFTLPATGI